MKSDKVLMFGVVFNLPDDFQGTKDDAIELMMEYYRTHPNLPVPERVDGEKASWDIKQRAKTLWADDKGKLSAVVQVGVYNKETHKWEVTESSRHEKS